MNFAEFATRQREAEARIAEAASWKSRAEAAEARIQALEAERDEALRECARWSREAGEAKGRLEMSEAAGIVEGWREKCEGLEREVVKLRGALEPFAQASAANPSSRGFIFGWNCHTGEGSLTWEHLRIARTALQAEGVSGEGGR